MIPINQLTYPDLAISRGCFIHFPADYRGFGLDDICDPLQLHSSLVLRFPPSSHLLGVFVCEEMQFTSALVINSPLMLSNSATPVRTVYC